MARRTPISRLAPSSVLRNSPSASTRLTISARSSWPPSENTASIRSCRAPFSRRCTLSRSAKKERRSSAIMSQRSRLRFGTRRDISSSQSDCGLQSSPLASLLEAPSNWLAADSFSSCRLACRTHARVRCKQCRDGDRHCRKRQPQIILQHDADHAQRRAAELIGIAASPSASRRWPRSRPACRACRPAPRPRPPRRPPPPCGTVSVGPLGL